MAEGEVYVCRWTKDASGWELWLDRKPSLRASGDSYEQAENAFLSIIAEKLGDPAAVLQYVPPLPPTPSEASLLEPPLVLVIGDSGPGRFEPVENLFSDGICPSCGTPRGKRTDTPLAIGDLWPGHEGGFLGGGSYSIHYFSDRFISLLSESERSSLKFRPIKTIGKTRKRHYEMTAVAATDFTGVRGWDATGWECPACNTRFLYYQEPDVSISRFVRRADLPHDLPTCFPVGTGPGSYLAMRRERWLEMVTRREAKGCIGHPLGCVDNEQSDPSPRLERHWSVPCRRCTELPWPVLDDRRVWPLPHPLRGTAVAAWLPAATKVGSVDIVREPVSFEELLRIVEQQTAARKASLVYSFRCSECSRLGRIVINNGEVFVDLPFPVRTARSLCIEPLGTGIVGHEG